MAKQGYLILFASILLLLVPPLASADVIYEETFYYPGVDGPIDLIVIDSQEDFPQICLDLWTLVGCAIYGYEDGQVMSKLYLNYNFNSSVDIYGNSAMWHELKHLLCLCDYHSGGPIASF